MNKSPVKTLSRFSNWHFQVTDTNIFHWNVKIKKFIVYLLFWPYKHFISNMKAIILILIISLTSCSAIKCYDGIYLSHVDKSEYKEKNCPDYCLVGVGGKKWNSLTKGHIVYYHWIDGNGRRSVHQCLSKEQAQKVALEVHNCIEVNLFPVSSALISM